MCLFEKSVQVSQEKLISLHSSLNVDTDNDRPFRFWDTTQVFNVRTIASVWPFAIV